MTSIYDRWKVMQSIEQSFFDQNPVRAFSVMGDEATDVLLITEDGKVFGFGRNRDGMLGLGHKEEINKWPQQLQGFEGSEIVDIRHGWFHVMILLGSGQVYCWGYNGSGQCGDGTNEECLSPTRLIVSVSANEGPDNDLEVKFAAIRAGYVFSVGLTTDGQVYAWGSNLYGQVGIGNRKNQFVPVKVDLGLGLIVRSVECGGWHTLVLTKDSGQVFGWGLNNSGQLGNVADEEDNSKDVVKFVNFLSCDTLPRKLHIDTVAEDSFQGIAAGHWHSLLLTKEGQIFGCGDNRFGQLGCPRITDGPSQVWNRVQSDVCFESIISSYFVSIGTSGDQVDDQSGNKTPKHWWWGHYRNDGSTSTEFSGPSHDPSCDTIEQLFGKYLTMFHKDQSIRITPTFTFISKLLGPST